jgi:hypothetical protein
MLQKPAKNPQLVQRSVLPNTAAPTGSLCCNLLFTFTLSSIMSLHLKPLENQNVNFGKITYAI